MRALLIRSARAAFSRNTFRRSGVVALATLATNVTNPAMAAPSFTNCFTNSTTNRAALITATSIVAGTSIAYASAQPENYNPTKDEIAGCIAAIESILDDNDDIGPTIVRLAWHASGTYDKESNSGGSDGATMRFKPEANHGANAGLHVARNALEPVKKLFPNISYADIWTLAGAVAIEYMGGPKITWNPGRRDALTEAACPPDGRLPDADKGQVGKTIRHIRDIFYRQGFNDREICALVGAHALGRCHANASGYEGPWTRAPTTFSNEYFKELLNNEWTLKTWDGPDQFEDPTGALMMLPADMALLWDKEFRKFVKLYAEDEETFFKDFAKAFQKLEENGVKALGGGSTNESWWKFW